MRTPGRKARAIALAAGGERGGVVLVLAALAAITVEALRHLI